MYEEFHKESPKQMSAPTLSVRLDEILPENSKEKQEDIVVEEGITSIRCVNTGSFVKQSKSTSRIPILVKTGQAKKSRIAEQVHNQKVTRSRSSLPVPIRARVMESSIKEADQKKKVTNGESRIPLPTKSIHVVKKPSITEAVHEKVANSGSRIPLPIKKTIMESSIPNVEHNKTVTKRSRLPVPIKRKVKNQINAKAVQRENVAKRSRIPISIKMKVNKPEVEKMRSSDKEKVSTNRPTIKRGSQRPTHGNKRSTKNTKADKIDKGETRIAKEITHDSNDKIEPQRKTVDRKIANTSGQNDIKRNTELNKSRAVENRKSKGFRNSDQRTGHVKEMKENNTRFSGKMKTKKKTILNKEDTLFSQDGEIGECMPKLQALADMKDVLAKQINDMKKEIGDLKKQDAEARVTPVGVYTTEMFDNDSNRIQMDIWEIKRQIITMKYLDQSTFVNLESRIMEVKGANKELESNLKRIKFTQEHDVKNESGTVATGTEMACSDPIIGETHNIPRPPSDKKPRGKFTRKRLLKQ